MHAARSADHVPGDDLLNVTAESDFVRPIVGNAKTLCNVGFTRRLGSEWNSKNREHQAAQQPCDHSYRFRQSSTPHGFAPSRFWFGCYFPSKYPSARRAKTKQAGS